MVDRSFVAGLGAGGRDSAIVSAMVDLAHRLDLAVVAEGVEWTSDLETVRKTGCDEAQGDLLGKPTHHRGGSSTAPLTERTEVQVNDLDALLSLTSVRCCVGRAGSWESVLYPPRRADTVELVAVRLWV